jgi:anti-sigma regulatory factor (Ser/Thr protein kinase)
VEWSLEPGDIAAIPRLRQQIMRYLSRFAAPDADLGASAVVVGELLSNALAHSLGRAWISLRWDGPHPLLSVADTGPGLQSADHPATSGLSSLIKADRTLVPRLPDDPLARGGRGLYLVAHLSLDVAVATRATGGTVISVSLDLERAGEQVKAQRPSLRVVGD